MDNAFCRALDRLLHGFGERRPPEPAAAASSPPDSESAASRRERWFAGFAEQRVMPLLRQTADAIERRDGVARCWLDDSDGTLRARLEITPPGLPEGAHPPRLTISVADKDHLLAIDYTGTFPGAGASGGFGAEIDYDTIRPGQLEEEILNFVACATGA